MKKTKINAKRFFIFLIIIALIVIIIINIANSSKKSILLINDSENITKIISQKNNEDKKVEISSKDIINTILNYLENEKITSNKKSSEDIPNVDEYYIITFKDTDETIYLYKDKNKFCIEVPLEGIYYITEEQYQNILNYLYID